VNRGGRKRKKKKKEIKLGKNKPEKKKEKPVNRETSKRVETNTINNL